VLSFSRPGGIHGVTLSGMRQLATRYAPFNTVLRTAHSRGASLSSRRDGGARRRGHNVARGRRRELVVGRSVESLRAEALRAAVAGQTGQMISLVEGDVVLPEVPTRTWRRGRALDRLSGAIFPRSGARKLGIVGCCALRSRGREFRRPDAAGEGFGGSHRSDRRGGSLVLLATMPSAGAFASSLKRCTEVGTGHAARILAKQFRGVRVNVVAPARPWRAWPKRASSSGKYDGTYRVAPSEVWRPEDIGARGANFPRPTDT